VHSIEIKHAHNFLVIITYTSVAASISWMNGVYENSAFQDEFDITIK